MGYCCSSSRDKGETIALQELYKMKPRDLTKFKSRKEMDKNYDILNSDMQSHLNVYGNNLLEKNTQKACYCKVI